MSDLVERLRNASNWLRQGFGHWKDVANEYDRTPFEATDEIERLEKELADGCWTDERGIVWRAPAGWSYAMTYRALEAQRAEKEQLERELAQCREDAERYRWLRGEVHGPHVPLAQVVWKLKNERNSGQWSNLADGPTLDAAIDAARASKSAG